MSFIKKFTILPSEKIVDDFGFAFAIESDADLEMCKVAAQEARLRKWRVEVLGSDLCGDPAWDLLIEIYLSQRLDKPLSVTAASHVSGIAPTTSLRWIELLGARGMIARDPDPNDKRRTWLVLTEKGANLVEKVLAGPKGEWTRPVLRQFGLKSQLDPAGADRSPYAGRAPTSDLTAVHGSDVDFSALARECESTPAESQEAMIFLVAAVLLGANNTPPSRKISVETARRIGTLVQMGAFENAALALLPDNCSYTGGWFPGDAPEQGDHPYRCVGQVSINAQYSSASTKAATLPLAWLAAYLRALNMENGI